MARNKFGRPKRRKINLGEVEELLGELGFASENIKQEWRHVVAEGVYQGKKAVFKLGSTQTTSKLTNNEFFWNQAVHLVPDDLRPNFTVPENYGHGRFGKLFYFIAERFDRPLLKGGFKLDEVKDWISPIAQVTREVELLRFPEDCEFVRRNLKKKTKKNKKPTLLRSAEEWAKQVPLDLSKFLRVIEAAGELKRCPGHGDWVLRQMYDVDGRIGVIDGEHAGLFGPLYFDVAQFYLRLRNDSGAKDMAGRYLQHFRDLLSVEERSVFWEQLKPVLINRYIGDLWGAANKPDKLEKLSELGEEILGNKIII